MFLLSFNKSRKNLFLHPDAIELPSFFFTHFVKSPTVNEPVFQTEIYVSISIACYRSAGDFFSAELFLSYVESDAVGYRMNCPISQPLEIFRTDHAHTYFV